VRILAGGLSQAKTVTVAGEEIPFRALAGLPRELETIESIYGQQRSIVLADDLFRKENVSRQLDRTSFPVVHLATHAQFRSDVRKTFVLTQDDRPLDMAELERLIQPSQFRGQPVELLTLSACETVAGDDGRAALGLAGVAIRAGARSTLGTLWVVNDEIAATLVPIFYRELNSSASMSKAEAMRQAQLQVLRTSTASHPRFWAPFVIVGNWR
jgi:CHAT domain-containing protein